jgi:predicted secreted hydrolase
MSTAAAARAAGAARAARGFVVAALAVVLAGCSGGLLLANGPLVLPTPAAATAAPSRPPDPRPIHLPRDDGPHDRLTEWWYYTGHLVTESGRHYGFEAVIFRAERGDVPVTWASHLALTDEGGNGFSYAQRSEIGAQVDRSPHDGAGAPTGFDLAIAGDAHLAPWELAGSDGHDTIRAATSNPEVTGGGVGLDLTLSAVKRPALHQGIGWVPFGPAGGSYYYSRPRLSVDGTLVVDGVATGVTGLAWFDHQWGDFISVGGGGWDWFAVNLDDGTDLTLSLVRAADGTYPLVYGTHDDASGAFSNLTASDFTVMPTGSWTSPATGATYPAGWRIAVPGRDLLISLTPTVSSQELDTRATTGVVYWEGSQVVGGTRAGIPLRGEGYVELTGYAPSGVAGP